MKSDPGLDWRSVPTWGATVRVGERALVVMITSSGPAEYRALALEIAGDATGVEHVFADHAHDAIGVYRSEKRARWACEKYAKQYVARAERCECATIEPRRPSGTPSPSGRRFLLPPGRSS